MLCVQTEHKKREKARKAAIKPGVEYDEDGKPKVQTLDMAKPGNIKKQPLLA